MAAARRAAAWVLAGFLAACGGGGGGGDPRPAPDVPDAPADAADDPGPDMADVPAASCGNGACDGGENCWTCPSDCDCRCGDGACTHGEACRDCPADCDCTTPAATPPMGWNSWNRFACDISDTLAREIAQAMVDSGMRDAGYRYLNLDDCWQVDRDGDDVIVADPVRFPHGMKALGDHVHDLGLLYGLYTCAGSLTCQKRPGSLGFEALDMATYAAWGVDYVKVDWCFAEELVAREQYGKFRRGIDEAGRPIMLSLCNWGLQDPWVWGAQAGSLWRTSADISDSFTSMLLNLELAAQRAAYAGPGHWNDPDMLEVGNGGMTADQYRSHMGHWALLAAPLIAGNDLRTMDEETRAILTNPEVIAVDQDPLGLQGVRVVEGDSFSPDVWVKPLARPGWRAVVVFNRGFDPVDGVLPQSALALADGPVTLRDLWARQDVGEMGEALPVTLPPGASRMFVAKGAEPLPPAGTSFLSDLPWTYATASRGPVERDRSNGGTGAGDGPGLSLRGTPFAKGIGAYAGSIVVVPLGGRCTAFRARAGVDDAAGGAGSATFEVWADGRRLWDSGPMTGADPARDVQVDLSGRVLLKLVTTAASDYEEKDFVDWAEARVDCR